MRDACMLAYYSLFITVRACTRVIFFYFALLRLHPRLPEGLPAPA